MTSKHFLLVEQYRTAIPVSFNTRRTLALLLLTHGDYKLSNDVREYPRVTEDTVGLLTQVGYTTYHPSPEQEKLWDKQNKKAREEREARRAPWRSGGVPRESTKKAKQVANITLDEINL